MSQWSRPHICQCLTRLLTLRCNSTVTIAKERRKSGEKFIENVLCLAHKLSGLGLRPGHIVSICAFNSDWYLEWLLAVAYIGGIIAPLNYRWSLEESKLALEVIRPEMIVTDESCTWLLELQNGSIFSPRWHVSIGFHYSNSNGTQKLLKAQSIKYCWAPDDIVIICFTSGSTGKPKGVSISHTSLIMQSLAKIAIVGYTEDDVYLHTAPLCHIGGISSCLAMLMVGGCHVLIPKFEVRMALKAIKESCVTSFITVPAILASLISVMRHNESWKSEIVVKKILNGGGSLSIQLIEDAVRCFHGAKLLSAYGMTEACSSLTFITLFDPAINNSNQIFEKLSKNMSNSIAIHPMGGICVGKPAPHVEIKIEQEESSQVGRIMTRGPHVMVRYWGQTSALDVDSSLDWLDTGDSGHIDSNGNLWLVGRRNCRIKSGGENVYPEEVEDVLSQHPGILDVVVVGLPHPSLGEMVVACFHIRENWIWSDSNNSELPNKVGRRLSTDVLKEYCRRKHLTGFKIPKAFLSWREPFSVTSTGKIRRDQVKAKAMLLQQPLLSNL